MLGTPLPPPAPGPISRSRGALLWLAVVGGIGLLLFTYRHLDALVTGRSQPALEPFLTEMTAAFAAGILFFAVRALVRRLPLTRECWARRLPLYLGATLLFGAAQTSLMWGLREVVFRLSGLGDYDYGQMPMRYLMELPVQALAFWVMVGALYAAAQAREARERELHSARLAAGLARAELSNLRLQLQPHFLFNTLNTISATMYDDPERADEMLDRLAELLRASLKTARTDEVPLGEELRVLDLYLELLAARFGERLRVAIDADAEAAGILVPSMILQPLVENAVRHGRAEREGRGAVAVRARRQGERLVIEVEDDGPGLAPGADPLGGGGVGLAAARDRLSRLYGAAGTFAAQNVPDGFRVRIEVPAATASGSGAAEAPEEAPELRRAEAG